MRDDANYSIHSKDLEMVNIYPCLTFPENRMSALASLSFIAHHLALCRICHHSAKVGIRFYFTQALLENDPSCSGPSGAESQQSSGALIVPMSPSRNRGNTGNDGGGVVRGHPPRRISSGLLRTGRGFEKVGGNVGPVSPTISDAGRRVTWADDEENMEPLEQVCSANTWQVLQCLYTLCVREACAHTACAHP